MIPGNIQRTALADPVRFLVRENPFGKGLPTPKRFRKSRGRDF
jgi:hypothetical protein